MKKRLKDLTVVIPLHLALNYPCDYIDQTANILKKRNSIVFFDFNLPFSWKEILSGGKLKMFLSSVTDICREKNTVVYFRPFSLLPLQRNNFIYKLNRIVGILELRLLLFIAGKKTLVWGFHPMMSLLLNYFGKKKYVYDCIDLLGQDKATKIIDGDEKKLFEKTDLAVFISPELARLKIAGNPHIKDKSLIAVCGCNVDLFTKRVPPAPELLKKGGKVICAGVIDFRYNFDLLEYIVKKNRRVQFFFVGPVQHGIDNQFFRFVNNNSNCSYIAKKPKYLIPNYLQAADIGIIPYDTSLAYIKHGNPMKAYEYLASGIPVVSTNIYVLKSLPKDIVFTTDDFKKFSDRLRFLLKNWNKVKAGRAKKIARHNSWENKVRQIESFILKRSF